MQAHLPQEQVQNQQFETTYTTHEGDSFANLKHLLEEQGTIGTMEDSRVYDYNPTRLYIFTYFESYCLRVRLPISLKLGAN